MTGAPTNYSPQPQVPSPTAPPTQPSAHASLPPTEFYPPPVAHVPPPMASYPPPPSQGIAISDAPKVIGQWSTGLYDCLDDVELCCITCLCPCITFGQIAEIVDRGTTSCGKSGALYGIILALGLIILPVPFSCLYSCSYRSKMRSQYNLPKEPCTDCCVHWWCECCSLCQEYRELRNRGYDMSIGWRGSNTQNLQAAKTVAVPPPVHGGMKR